MKRFTQTASSLQNLLKEKNEIKQQKKHQSITWNISCQFAFNKLKRALTNELILIQLNLQMSFMIETDALKWAISYVLFQIKKDEKLHSIIYDDKKLSDAKLNYFMHEKELFTVKHAIII